MLVEDGFYNLLKSGTWSAHVLFTNGLFRSGLEPERCAISAFVAVAAHCGDAQNDCFHSAYWHWLQQKLQGALSLCYVQATRSWPEGSLWGSRTPWTASHDGAIVRVPHGKWGCHQKLGANKPKNMCIWPKKMRLSTNIMLVKATHLYRKDMNAQICMYIFVKWIQPTSKE